MGRPTLQCSQCGYAWTPRGKNYSIRCPSCGARNTASPVSLSGVMVILVAGGGLAFACCGGLSGVFTGGVAKQHRDEPRNDAPVTANVLTDIPAEPVQEDPVDNALVVLPPMPESESPAPFGREFIDKTGKHRTRAELVVFKWIEQGSKVVLRKEDGTQVELLLSTLSRADQEWVKDEVRRRKGE